MTDKEIIQQAIKIIKRDWDARCKEKDFSYGCAECHAGLTIRHLKLHLEMLSS